MSRLLILGARGTVSTQIMSLLKDHTLIKASSKPTQSDEVLLNLVTGEGLKTALKNIDAAFLFSPPGHTNQDELLLPVIKEAKASGVKKIVLMTAMGVDANEEAPLRKVERALESSGLSYNIIRPNWFMQNFNSYWIQGINEFGKILLPTGAARGSFIDARDIAAVAAKLLVSSEWNNQAFDLTGSQSLDHHEVAGILSRVTGREITYQDIPSSEMRGILLSAGVPAPYTEFMLTILEFFKLGYSERVTNSVLKITGAAPRTFEAYAQDFKAAWIK